MKRRSWNPGLEGLICLPSSARQSGGKGRDYFIYDVDEKGHLSNAEGPTPWSEADERVRERALEEKKEAFSTPEGKHLQRLLSEGYFGEAD